jgi:DNA repair exonuclease SbcCD ATPase subunit
MAAKDRGKGQGTRGKGEEAVPAKLGSLDAELDTLFQLAPGEFTTARNALAARLKKSGRAEDAEQVKALAKPPVTAWTVNQLYWQHREAFDQLIATGERFRKAQASQLAGKAADMRGPLEARRAALAEMAKLAAVTLRDGGGSATPDNMRRITTTLEALSTYGSHPDAPRPGRLLDDVEPPGFETLAALVPRVGDGGGHRAGPPHVLPFHQKQRPAKRPKGKATAEEDAQREAEERKAQRAAAKAAVQESERALREARKEAQQAEERLKKAAARAKEAEQEKTEAEQRLEKAAADADAARQQARRVAAEAEEAAQVLQDAERALEKAQREWEELE